MRMPNSTDFVSAVPIEVGMRCHRSHAFHRVGLPWGVRAETPNKYEEVVTMRIPTITKYGVVASAVVLFAALSMRSTQSAQAADLLVERTMGFATVAELDVMASSAAEDTLKACMARIPAFASAGQRMLAERSCAGEEEVRKTLRSAPKF
jgi:hypothetical protein